MKKKKHRAGCAVFCIFAVLLLLPALLFAGTAWAMRGQFGRGDYPDTRFSLMTRYSETENAVPREMVSFRSGDNMLVGYIYGAENEKGLVVWSHGIGCGHEAYLNEILWLAGQGWRVFAYDGTGCGESGGSGSRGLAQSALDLDAALDLAERDLRLAGMQTVLVGHSWGGYAAAAVLPDHPRIRAAVSISGYSDPMEMTAAGAEKMLGKALSTVIYPFEWFYNRMLFGEAGSRTAVEAINHSTVPVLIMHGEHDTDVSYDRCGIIAKRDQITKPDVVFETLTGPYADHNSFFLSDEANAYRAERLAEYDALKAQNGSELTDAQKDAFIAGTDPVLYHQCSDALMTRIDSFLTEHLPDLPDESDALS